MIRRARDGDRGPIAALQGRLDTPAPRLLEAAFDAGVATLLVAEAGDELVGYALAVPGDPDAAPSVVYLSELVVAPGHRRTGWGTALLDRLCELSADHDEIRAVARADDDAVLAFYRDRGFEPRGTRPDEYALGDGHTADGVLLARDLA